MALPRSRAGALDRGSVPHNSNLTTSFSLMDKHVKILGEEEHVADVAAPEQSTSDGDKDGDKEEETVVSDLATRKASERAILRKLDARLLPTVVIIFLMNYIDRIAVSSARLQGLEADLGLADTQYDTVLIIVYASYCPAQIPSNMLLNYVRRPTLYIGSCVVLWGLLSALTGVTRNFGDIITCRVLLGIPEAAFYPGAMYLLSSWYTRKELAFRSGILYAGLLISNAFGSLIAAGILANMQGTLGIAAWRWLFYIEGAITIFIGFQAMWLLPDYPHNTRWLSPAERRLAQARLAEDAGEADQDPDDASPFAGLWMALKDPKVPIFMIMNCAQLVGLSFISFFPTLTATLNFSTTVTLLMSAPPWVFAAICTLIGTWSADRTGERFFHMTAWWWVVMVGYIIALATHGIAPRYFSLFLMTTGYCGFTMVLVWVSNAIPRPPAKRSVAMGLINGFGNVGALIGGYIWPTKWSPGYRPTMIIAVCCLALATCLSFLIRCMLAAQNRALERSEKAVLAPSSAERARVEEAARLEGISFDEAVRRQRGFRYLL